MKIAIVLGSVRAERQSSKVGNYVAHLLESKGYEVTVVDLARAALPIYGSADPNDEKVKRIIDGVGAQLQEADALILVTPEYHGTFSGVLKNALDYYWSEFKQKAMGVVAASAGKMAGINASTQLQHVILSLGAFPLPLKLLVPEVHNAFDESGQPANADLTRHTQKFLEEFLWFSLALKTAKKEALI